jgi:type II secretory pathway component PulF
MIAVEFVLLTALAALALGYRSGVLGRIADHLLLTGPLRRTASAVVYGSFAIVLGGMLTAGAPMSDALRLAVRTVRSGLGRRRLEPILQEVRQGQSLSHALEKVGGFPQSIWSLAAVGEASGALGPMLVRSGKLEEDAALARIEAAGQVIGPALIVALGGLVGLLMAGLLSGVSQLGQSALN